MSDKLTKQSVNELMSLQGKLKKEIENYHIEIDKHFYIVQTATRLTIAIRKLEILEDNLDLINDLPKLKEAMEKRKTMATKFFSLMKYPYNEATILRVQAEYWLADEILMIIDNN